MFVLNNPGIRHFIICVIHHCISLVIPHIQHFCLKAQGTVLQGFVTIIEILVNHACIDNLIRLSQQSLFFLEKVHSQTYLYALQQFLDNPGISPFGNPLIGVVEIVIVISVSKGQPADNKGRQVFALPAPLLAGISFD